MAGKKKVGGVKQKRQGNIPAADAAPRKIGGVKAPIPRGAFGVTGHMESCPDNCPGEYVKGMWIHSRECPWASVLWKQHDKTTKDWHCPFDCDPHEMPSGWTHPHSCPFWDYTGRTPFDHREPRESPRATTQEVPTKAILPINFEDFPEALADDGDDLPF